MKRNAVLLVVLVAATGACTVENAPPDKGEAPGTTSRQVSGPDVAALQGVSSDSGQVGKEPAYATGAPPTPVPDLRGGMTVTGQLTEVNRSGVTGSMTVSQVGPGTLVSVALYESAPNTTYRVDVSRGRCGSSGAVVAPVGTIRAGGTGTGAVTDTLSLSATTVMDGEHVLTVRGANAGPEVPPQACADIPLNRPEAMPR